MNRDEVAKVFFLQEQLGVTGSPSVNFGQRKKFRHVDPVEEKTFEVGLFQPLIAFDNSCTCIVNNSLR